MWTSRATRIVVVAALLLATSFSLSLVWTVLLSSRSKKVILENCDASFCLRVAEGQKSYGLLSTEQLYEVWITRRGSPDYGYLVHHSFAWHGFDTNKTIAACKVTWSADGVTLLEPTGQQLFVPQKSYAAGR